MKKTHKIIISVVIAIAVVAFGILGYMILGDGFTSDSDDTSSEEIEDTSIVGLSLGTLREERWSTDRDLFVKKAEELGMKVNVVSANSDAALQKTQVENMINQGIKVIVIVPEDGEDIASIVGEAHEAGVKILAYDRMIKNSDVDAYVSFDNVKVGEMQANGVLSVVDEGNFAYIGGSPTDNNSFLLKEGSMSILNPLITSGKINLVLEEFSEDWSSDESYKNIKNYLETGGELDAVVAANDGTAFGVIEALKEYNLSGIVPVSGQDADLAACRRIVEGTQAVTVYKPISLLANKAAEIALAMMQRGQVSTNSVVNNGQMDVPSYLIEPIMVNKENMLETVIEDEFHSYEEVFEGAEE